MGITFDREQHKFQFDFEHDGTSDLNSKINLYDYDLVIYPESSSQVNQYFQPDRTKKFDGGSRINDAPLMEWMTAI